MHTQNFIRRLCSFAALLLPSLFCFGRAYGAEFPISRVDSDTAFIKQSWKAAQGLPSDSVEAILQTRDGYLWIGTRAGLARFDGVKFINFTRSNTPEMRSEFCASLAEDTEGKLWIGTHNGLLRYWKGAFTHFDGEGGLREKLIPVLCPSSSGGLWIGTFDSGLYYLEDGKFTHYAMEHGLPSNSIRSLFEEPKGRLWCGTFGKRIGVARREPFAQKFETLDAFDTPSEINAIHVGSDGACWLRFDHALHRFENGRLTFSVPQTKSPYGVSSVLRNRAGDFWLCTGHEVIDFLSDGQITRYSLNLAPTNGSTRTLHEDREGNLWIGSDYAGLHRWTPKRFQSFTTTNGLAHANARAVIESRDGVFWFGTEAGLSQLKEGKWKSYPADPTYPAVLSIVEDSTGAIWAGTLGHGVDRVHQGQSVNFPLPGGSFTNKVRVLLMGRAGTLWIGTEGGLLAMREGAIQAHFTTAQGLPHNLVAALHEDAAGRLWIGTRAGGLVQLGRLAIESFTPSNGPFTNLVRVIREDADGTLWVGSNGGLHRIQGGRMDSFTVKEGLPEYPVNLLIEDDQGRFWIGSDQSLTRVRRRDLQAVADGRSATVRAMPCDQADGLLSTVMSGSGSEPAAWKGRDGRLWFATSKGVAVVDPKTVIDNDTPPFVYVEQVSADREVIFDNSRRAAFQAAAATAPQRASKSQSSNDLPPGRGRFLEFQYTAPQFSAPHRVRFKYRLEGLEQNWTDAGTRRVAYYTAPPPGRYTFRVQACNEHGLWNEAGAAFAFYLAPYFWQTWWFHPAWISSAVLLGVGIHRRRIRRMAERKELENHARLAEQRALLGADLHDSAGFGLCEIIQQCKKAEEASGDARFGTIAASARDVLDGFDQTVWLLKPGNDTLDRLAVRFIRTLEKPLEAAGIRAQWNVPEDLPALSLRPEAQRDLLLVLREALHNVLKHARATHVRFELSLAGRPATSTLISPSLPSDGGEGRGEEARPYWYPISSVLSPFVPRGERMPSLMQLPVAGGDLVMALIDDGCGFDPAAVPVDRHGLGSLRRRAQKWQGQVEIVSHPGTGTQVQLRIPLKNLCP